MNPNNSSDSPAPTQTEPPAAAGTEAKLSHSPPVELPGQRRVSSNKWVKKILVILLLFFILPLPSYSINPPICKMGPNCPKAGFSFSRPIVLLVFENVRALQYRQSASVEVSQTESYSPTPPPAGGPTANWKTYSSVEFGFSIMYPSDWSLEEKHTPVDLAPYYGSETINSVKIFKDDTSVRFLSGVKSDVTNGQLGLVATEKIKISGQDATKRTYKLSGQKRETTSIKIALNSSIIYGIESLSPSSETTVIDQILSTFKFTKTVDTTNWKLYKNTEWAFSISYPQTIDGNELYLHLLKGWYPEGPERLLLFTDNQQAYLQDNPPDQTIRIELLRGVGNRDFAKWFSDISSGHNSLSTTSVKIGSCDGYYSKTNDSNSQLGSYIIKGVNTGSNYFALEVISQKDLPEVESIINSFVPDNCK